MWEKIYYWFWHDRLKRPEPLTYTMRRSAENHPWAWFLIPVAIGTLLIGGFYALIMHLAGWF